MAAALAYFITFTCYGARLHGGEHGSVGRGHRLFGTPLIAPCRPFEAEMEDLMAAEAMVLTSAERQTVLASIRGTCGHFEWRLMAAHVRTNHVHVVVGADADTSIVLHRLKAYATRALNGAFGVKQKRWARHGSTRYLFNEVSVAAAILYVVEAQGVPMAVYHSPAGRECLKEPRQL